ncbi:MAG TPA: hypothetical protein VI197_10060 [Polyangiaceae bacterium]
MTPDIELLRDSLDELEDQVDYLELELVDTPDWAEPSDTSYLTDEDRSDPETMDNVDAMQQTNRLIAWFGRDMEGFVGLWRGPDDTPLESAPVVRLDTEGQYAVVARTIGDYIAISVDEDDFDAAREALIDAGFEVSKSSADIWQSIEDLDDPNEFRGKLYNAGRVRRGLDPIE